MSNKETYESEDGFTDAVGGYHVGGTGYAPSGEFCGECCRATCEGCSTVQKQDNVLPTKARDFITSRFLKKE